MGKKTYIIVIAKGKNYKLYMDDLHKIHRIYKERRPPVPAYNQEESPRKFEELTDIEFEPLFLS